MVGQRTADVDRDLIKSLHDEHAAALWSFAVRLTGGDRVAAEDVVQETMLRAWRNIQQPGELASAPFSTAETGAARGWLYTVARRIVIDEWRARSVRPECLMPDLPESVTSDGTEQLVQTRVMSDALNRLSPEHRMVLFEMFYRRSSVREAARTIGIAEGTVKSRTHYALRALRLALAELGETR
jgi:RNA polymerase sigma-70 factor (ECF subfamily)